MGKVDTIMKKYMRDPEIFADVFNQFLYHGEQVIHSENLTELDTAEIVIPYGESGAGIPEQKYRDVLKLMMTDGNIAYCILGIENQSDIHYAMPVKNMVYDSMQLAHQVAEVINAVTHSKLKYPQGKGKIDMYVAIQEMVADGEAKGRLEGKLEGAIKTYKEVGFSLQETVQRIANSYNFSLQESKEKVEQYW